VSNIESTKTDQPGASFLVPFKLDYLQQQIEGKIEL
jgi:hypothetical protein